MGKVILSEFVTLDGVMQDPGGGGEFEHGGWQVPFFDEDINTFAQEILSESDALLLGRVTYEQFAQAWPTLTDEQGFAERMNTMPKYVASTTLTEPLEWNASLIRGDVAKEVAKLKARPQPAGQRERQAHADSPSARPRRRLPYLDPSRRPRRRKAVVHRWE
jgi:dihydrofolate reductase